MNETSKTLVIIFVVLAIASIGVIGYGINCFTSDTPEQQIAQQQQSSDLGSLPSDLKVLSSKVKRAVAPIGLGIAGLWICGIGAFGLLNAQRKQSSFKKF